MKTAAKNLENLIVSSPKYVENWIHIILFNFEDVYFTVVEKIDINKKNYGKRNFNLIAFVGQKFINEFYFANNYERPKYHQINRIYNYLSNDVKEKLNNIIKSELKDFYEYAVSENIIKE